MTVWQAIRTRWRALFHKRQRDAEIDEELAFHVDMQTRENIESGMDPEEARYAALRRVGGLDQIKEACRDVPGVRWIEDAIQDLRFGARMLIKAPGFTMIALLTLALGIGANTALFSIVDKLILNPIPARDSDRLIHLQEMDVTHNQARGVSPPVFMELLRLTNTFESLTALNGTLMVVPGREFSETIYGADVTAGVFELLKVQPLLGRTFRPDEGAPGNDSVLLISHRFWQNHFGADPGVVGKTISLGDKSWTIVGVMPPSFQFPHGSEYCQFWRPHVFHADEYDDSQRYNRNWDVLARLRPGVSLTQARALLEVMTQRLQKDFPEPHAQYSLRAYPARFMFVTEELQKTLWSLLAAVVFVLIVACANIANVLLARAETRHKELTVRLAIGASRQRIVRQLLTESVLLSLLGGAVGLFLAWVGVRLLADMMPTTLPRMKDLGLDWQVFGWATVISVLAGVGFGLAPAWLVSQTRLNESLKEVGTSHSGSARRRLFHQTLVVVEIALALVLLTGAGLMIHSVASLLRVNPGFDPKGLVWVMFHYPSNVPQEAGRTEVWHKALAERLRSLPGVDSAAFQGNGGGWYSKVEGRATIVRVSFDRVDVGTSNCFRTLRTPLVAGRFFEEADASPDAKTILVNQELARLAWPGENPLGKRIAYAEEGGDWLEVVGVVGNTKDWRLDQPPRPFFYEPYQRDLLHEDSPVFVVRTTRDPMLLTKPLRDLAREMAPGATAPIIYFVERELYSSTQLRRTYMWFLNLFGLIGLTLSGIGLYGVLSYSVVQRTREIGVRMALGANTRDVLILVLRQGGRLMLVGGAVGLVGAIGLTHLLRSLLFGTSATDPLVFVCALMVLLLVALTACYLPARRASRVDPAVTLRHE